MTMGASLLVASLALAGCGSRGDDSGDAKGGDTGGNAKVAKIGVIAPLSGDLSALGKGIQHSVELAVKQANDNKTIPGWTLEVEAVDDEGKADVGKNGATKLAGDDNVVGVDATLNSSVSQQTQPV
jgi:branched-chain amino acid transport system substrate-binding protein